MAKRKRNKKNSPELNRIADELIKGLKERGIQVMRSDSVTTNSIYLKLDSGVLNSVRIGDHWGLVKYSFRYNVLTSVEEHYKDEKNGHERNFFPSSNIQYIINYICNDKQLKIIRYGMNNYRKYMEKNEKENKGAKGFWSKAVKV